MNEKEKTEEKLCAKSAKVPVKEAHGISALMRMKRVCRYQGFTVVRIHRGRFECYDTEGKLRQIVISTMR